MKAKGWVVSPDGGRILSMAPGRFSALKLLRADTADSIMLFEQTAPPGTETTFHLHRDSGEVAYVPRGEITFKIGEEVTIGGASSCAFFSRGVPHAWKNTGSETGRVMFFHTPGTAGGFFEERLDQPEGSATAPRRMRCGSATGGRWSGRHRSEPGYFVPGVCQPKS